MTLALSFTFFLLFAVSAAVVATAATAEDVDFGLTPEKKTHLHFYMHDTASGPNATATRVVIPKAINDSPFLFGAMTVIDDRLTTGPKPTSKLIGRAQGMYAEASLQGADLLWTVNLVFGEGEYSGSTLAILALDNIFLKVREMPIVGGTGKFRLARGYALMNTIYANFTTFDAILEFHVYVIHY